MFQKHAGAGDPKAGVILREQRLVITHSRTESQSFSTFTPHADEVVHAFTRLKIKFHIFTPKNLLNHVSCPNVEVLPRTTYSL